VVWSGLSPDLATWGDMEALKQQFPHAPAWGQAVAQDRGNVSSASPDAVDEATPAGPRRGSRLRKSNFRVTGPEWE
jgi:hypothetical protein